jgi:hypothetical protein
MKCRLARLPAAGQELIVVEGALELEEVEADFLRHEFRDLAHAGRDLAPVGELEHLHVVRAVTVDLAKHQVAGSTVGAGTASVRGMEREFHLRGQGIGVPPNQIHERSLGGEASPAKKDEEQDLPDRALARLVRPLNRDEPLLGQVGDLEPRESHEVLGADRTDDHGESPSEFRGREGSALPS